MSAPARLAAGLAAAALLAGCADKEAPTRTYVPAENRDPSPAPAGQPYPAAPRPPDPASGLRGPEALAAANRAVVEPDGDQMRGAVWSVPDASCDEPYHLYVADRTATTVLFPAGETFQKIIPPNRDLYAYSVSDAGDRVTVSLSPQGRQRTATLNVATDRCVYLFTVDTTSDARALRALELNRPERRRPSAAPAPLPDGAVTQLHFAAANGQPPPPWSPSRGFADPFKTVVCLGAGAGPLPTLPVIMAGGQGEQAIPYHLVSDGGQQCLATYRRLTEFHLVLPPDDVAVSAGGR